MGYRVSVGAIGCVLGILAAAPLTGQVHKGSTLDRVYKVPRTPDGQPDLQGIWSSATMTPLERPRELAGKEFFTEQEASDYEKQLLKPAAPNPADGIRSFGDEWSVKGGLVPTRRTSLIIDPPNGRLPSLTPDGQKRADAHAEERKLHDLDGPENQSARIRCIVGNGGPPIMPYPYNSNYQIVQAPGYVLILSEQIHDARVIPLDGRPHLAPNVRQWLGDSRGHWEGNTLVVETTNFTGDISLGESGQAFRFIQRSEGLRVVERFSRASPDMILYDFTVEDPGTFTKPWTAQLPLQKTQGPIFEYACHEANYSLANLLSSARAQEKADTAKKESKKVQK